MCIRWFAEESTPFSIPGGLRSLRPSRGGLYTKKVAEKRLSGRCGRGSSPLRGLIRESCVYPPPPLGRLPPWGAEVASSEPGKCIYEESRFSATFWAVRTRLELATSGVTGRHSNQTELPHRFGTANVDKFSEVPKLFFAFLRLIGIKEAEMHVSVFAFLDERGMGGE